MMLCIELWNWPSKLKFLLSSIAREDAAEAAQQVIKAAEVVQELAATEAEGISETLHTDV